MEKDDPIGQILGLRLFLLAVAFAAPLLRFMGLPSFVVCIYGTSKVGKSTALLLASSVIGTEENEMAEFKYDDRRVPRESRPLRRLLVRRMKSRSSRPSRRTRASCLLNSSTSLPKAWRRRATASQHILRQTVRPPGPAS